MGAWRSYAALCKEDGSGPPSEDQRIAFHAWCCVSLCVSRHRRLIPASDPDFPRLCEEYIRSVRASVLERLRKDGVSDFDSRLGMRLATVAEESELYDAEAAGAMGRVDDALTQVSHTLSS
jgi:hypothetical protein